MGMAHLLQIKQSKHISVLLLLCGTLIAAPVRLQATSIVELYTVQCRSANTSMGTVFTTHQGAVEYHTQVSISATSAIGYRFVRWTDELTGDVVTQNPYTFNVETDVSWVAEFEPYGFTVVGDSAILYGTTPWNPDEEANRMIYSRQNYTANTIWNLTVTERTLTVCDSPYSFHVVNSQNHAIQFPADQDAQVEITQNGVYDLLFTFNDNSGLNEVKVIVVLVEALSDEFFHIELESATPAWGTVFGSGDAQCGEMRTISAIPAEGFAFSHWSDGNTEATRTLRADNNYSLTAYFTCVENCLPTDRLYLPADATDCPDYYKGTQPTWLAYPTSIKNKMPAAECSNQPADEGVIDGYFSVGKSESEKVRFAKGNLQYQPTTDTWRFADNQYDFIGKDNLFAAPNYKGRLDLFAWGTSGWDKGVACYEPWSSCTSQADYYITGNPLLSMTGQFADADWGYHNSISNGGDKIGKWRTPTYQEMLYLLYSRTNAAALQSRGIVNGCRGYILLPDNWTLPDGYQFTANATAYSTNNYSISQWKRMERNGAVFLPAAELITYDEKAGNFNYDAYRYIGVYMTATPTVSQDVLCFTFDSDKSLIDSFVRYHKHSVRLVQDAKPEQQSTDIGFDPIETIVQEEVICYRPTYTFMGHEYPLPSMEKLTDKHIVPYTLEYRDYDNCITYTMNLLVIPHPADTITTNIVLCQGEQLLWNGATITEKGSYTHQLTNQYGCDSIVTLNVSLAATYDTTFYAILHNNTTYSWEGDSYATEGTYTKHLQSTEGCDSTVTLNLIENNIQAHFLPFEYCADDSIAEFAVAIEEGMIDRLELIFNDSAKHQGLNDTIIADFTGEPIVLRKDTNSRAGAYEVIAMFYYKDMFLDSLKYQFLISYSASVLEQNWSDFIGVLTYDYNGGYDFVDFHWYKNGEPIEGATHSYIYGNIEEGAQYSVFLTESNGNAGMSCPITAQTIPEMTAHPTLLRRREPINIRTPQPVTIKIYDCRGALVSVNYVSADTTLPAPPQSGMYLLVMQPDNNSRSKIIKLIVE